MIICIFQDYLFLRLERVKLSDPKSHFPAAKVPNQSEGECFATINMLEYGVAQNSSLPSRKWNSAWQSLLERLCLILHKPYML